MSDGLCEGISVREGEQLYRTGERAQRMQYAIMSLQAKIRVLVETWERERNG